MASRQRNIAGVCEKPDSLEPHEGDPDVALLNTLTVNIVKRIPEANTFSYGSLTASFNHPKESYIKQKAGELEQYI